MIYEGGNGQIELRFDGDRQAQMAEFSKLTGAASLNISMTSLNQVNLKN